MLILPHTLETQTHTHTFLIKQFVHPNKLYFLREVPGYPSEMPQVETSPWFIQEGLVFWSISVFLFLPLFQDYHYY